MLTSNDQVKESDLPARLAKPVRRALKGAGYDRLEPIAKLTEADVLLLHGIEAKALNPLRRALVENGLSFAKDE